MEVDCILGALAGAAAAPAAAPGAVTCTRVERPSESSAKTARSAAGKVRCSHRVWSALRLLLGLLAARRERGCASVAEELPEELRQLVKCCGMPENACVTSSLHRTSVSVGGGAAPRSTPVAAVIGVYMAVAAAVPASSWSIVCHPRAQYHQEPSSI